MVKKILNNIVPISAILVAVLSFLFILYTTGFVGRTPKIGDIYVDNYVDPWSEQTKYIVLDVKDGWVLLKPEYGLPYPYRLMTVRSAYHFVGNTNL